MHGLTVYVKCAICRIYRNHSNRISVTIGNVSNYNINVLTDGVIISIKWYMRIDYNVTSEISDNQGAAMVNSKTNRLSPVKSSNTSDQIALLPTAEPIDNNNSVYQNYDAMAHMCRNSTYNNRETIICDAPLNRSQGNETKEDYYNLMVSNIS